MEKNLSNFENLEIILNLYIRETLFTAFKTLQGFGDSKKISGLNLDNFSQRESLYNNSIMISALALSFNVNSTNFSVINSEKSERYSIINLEKSDKLEKSEKIIDEIPEYIKKNKEQQINLKNNIKQNQIDDIYNKIINGENFTIDDEDTRTVNYSINTNEAENFLILQNENKKIKNKENKILNVQKNKKKDSLITNTFKDEENNINTIIRKKNKSIKKSNTMMDNKYGKKLKKNRGSVFLKDKKEIDRKPQLFEFDEISERSEDSRSDF